MSFEYLIDTQAILWYSENHDLLSPKAVSVISNPQSICYFSIASVWELAIKIKKGNLKLSKTLEETVFLLKENYFQVLDIEEVDVFKTMELDFFHKDPFDRIIISQALTRNIEIVSSDSVFDLYPIKRIW
jgi:PIN domain nuclease of toxin-antitoxin system